MTPLSHLVLQDLLDNGHDDDVVVIQDAKDPHAPIHRSTVKELAAAVRNALAAPPGLSLADGAWCPLDDTVLRLELTGWLCLTCGAGWDHSGRHGWWTSHGDLPPATCTEVGPAGICPQPRPCPQHAVLVDAVRVDQVDEAAVRLRQLDHRTAWTVVAGAAVLIGTVTGVATRPWQDQFPDQVVWAIAGAVVVAAALYLGATELARWLRGWWPYRHNRVLGTAAELGWDPPTTGEGEVPDA